MYRYRTLPALVLVTLAGVCQAEDDYDIKVYPCARAYEAIVIDGALDEPSWRRAPVVSGFTYYNGPELVDVQTSFQVIYDRARLVFGVVCDEPLMDKITPVAQARDSTEVFHGECIEIFIDPAHSHDRYYQFGINAAGSVYDSARTEAAWSADVEAKTTLSQDHWTLEVAIPWADLGVEPEPGLVVGFNVCRDRLVGNARQWTNWAQTKANFHDPERFAHLVLSPTAQQLGTMGEVFRKGERRGPIVVYKQGGFAQTSYRALAREAIGKLETRLDELAGTADHEPDEAARRELQKLTETYSEELAGLSARIESGEALDAADWTRMELRVTALTAELGEVIWQARLTALLSGI